MQDAILLSKNILPIKNEQMTEQILIVFPTHYLNITIKYNR